MASIGIPDTLLLMLLALVVFGPRRLPEIGRQIGKLMYEFRKVSNDFKYQMEEELRASEEADRQKKLQAAQLDAPAPAAETKPAEVLEPGVGTTIIDPTYSSALEAEEAAAKAQAVPAVEGEVRGEAARGLQILPPSTGETIAAQKPFRGRAAQETAEVVAGPGDGAVAGAVEAQPAGQQAGSPTGAEQEAHHA